ncbi:hypothetical protein CDL15_Pgr013848 [Punica granatum]|uniref:Uncharacterized protein n=1 Tax=Punica granatum TaxID=22663 RepID=A0A218WIW8_PUNGR|nr:hypothetical protein CDL15_Pgr013848 [Punica granatum]
MEGSIAGEEEEGGRFTFWKVQGQRGELERESISTDYHNLDFSTCYFTAPLQLLQRNAVAPNRFCIYTDRLFSTVGSPPLCLSTWTV